MEQGEAGSKRRLDGASSFHAQLALLLQQDLQARLRDVIGLDSFSRGTGYLTDWRAGLAAGLDSDAPGLHRDRLQRSLQRPGSCMALAVNSFLPWVPHPRKLTLCGLGEFTEIQFDGRCPTGVRGTPPHIEVLASGPMGVVGVTARVFDYLVKRRSRPSPAYGSLALPVRMAPWGELLREAGSDEPAFHHVDILTLAKLAVGLGRIFEHRPVRLLYLFAEPAQAAAVGPFAAHRAELAHLINGTSDSGVPLTAISFQELWQAWRDGQTPDAVRAVAAELCRRYAVAMPRVTSL